MAQAKKKNSSKVSWVFILGIVIASICFYYYLSNSASESSKTEIDITFMRGNKQVSVKRNISLQTSTSLIKTAESAMTLLIAGPTNIEKILGIFSEIPKDVKVIYIRQEGDTLLLNLSPEFIEGRSGASSIQAAIAQTVYTLTDLRKDILKVKFIIDGKDQEIVIGGEGLVIEGPIGKEDLAF